MAQSISRGSVRKEALFSVRNCPEKPAANSLNPTISLTRPRALERIDRASGKVTPDLVFACLNRRAESQSSGIVALPPESSSLHLKTFSSPALITDGSGERPVQYSIPITP